MSKTVATLTRKLPVQQGNSWDRTARTVDVIMSTGAAVLRSDYEHGAFEERLLVSTEAVNMTRLATGLPVLDSHDAFSIDSRVGTVIPDSVRIDGGKLVARIKLSKNARGEAIAVDLDDGHPLQMSVGYRIDKHTFAKSKDGRPAVLTATRWTPHEVSVVCVPADAGSHSRNLKKDRTMPPEIEEDTLEEIAAPSVRTVTEPKPFGPAERRAIAIRAGMTQEFYRANARKPEAAFREAVLDELVAIQEETGVFPIVETRGLRDTTPLSGMAEAVRQRLQPSFKASAAAAEFVGLSFTEMARRSIQLSGGSTNGMFGGNVIDAALGASRSFHTTSDFGPALGAAFTDVLMSEYEQLTSPILQAFKSETVPDFSEQWMVSPPEGGELLPINEHGEFRRGPLLGESVERASLGTFGRIHGVTRHVLVNDNLGAIRQIIDHPARRAAELEANIAIARIEGLLPMSDGLPVFHADHKNLAATPSDLDEDSLFEAILQVEKGHRHESGATIYMKPRFLIVPSEKRLKATRLLASVQATKIGDINALAGSLELIVEPRLNSPTAWYVAGDPNRHAGAIFLRLAGQEKPFVDTRNGFDVDGIEIKVRHDVGAGFADFRSWYKNAGV